MLSKGRVSKYISAFLFPISQEVIKEEVMVEFRENMFIRIFKPLVRTPQNAHSEGDKSTKTEESRGVFDL